MTARTGKHTLPGRTGPDPPNPNIPNSSSISNWSAEMREIVTIQVDSFANFVGSHFWTFQVFSSKWVLVFSILFESQETSSVASNLFDVSSQHQNLSRDETKPMSVLTLKITQETRKKAVHRCNTWNCPIPSSLGKFWKLCEPLAFCSTKVLET